MTPEEERATDEAVRSTIAGAQTIGVQRRLVRVLVHVTVGDPQVNGEYRWTANVTHSETRTADLDLTDEVDPASVVLAAAAELYREAS